MIIRVIKIKVDLGYLLMRVFQLSFEDPISLLMVSYFYYLQVNGRKQMMKPHNTVHSFTVKIS
jgi:hypothetical protein